MKYVVLGNLKSKNALVFLHGWGGDETSLQEFVKPFATTHRCFLFALHSIENEQTILCLNDYANAVLTELAHEEVVTAVFIVHSFGGRVVAKIWQQNAAAVQKIIFINAAGIKPKFSLRRWLRVRVFKFRRALGISTANAGSEDYKKLMPVMRQTFIKIITERLEKIYKKISVPALIIAGSDDKQTPPYMAKRLHTLIKNSRLEVINNCGHFAFVTHAADIKLLAQFFVNC